MGKFLDEPRMCKQPQVEPGFNMDGLNDNVNFQPDLYHNKQRTLAYKVREMEQSCSCIYGLNAYRCPKFRLLYDNQIHSCSSGKNEIHSS